MRIGRLLVAAVLVILVASCGSAITAVAADAAASKASYSSNVWTVAFILAGFIAFGIVLTAVLVICLPLTLILTKLGVPPLVRDAAFLLLAVVGAFLFPANAYPGMQDPFWSGLTLGLFIALPWIAAMRWAART